MSTNEDINAFSESDNDGPDIREMLFKYLRFWKWFVFSTVFFMLLGFIYLKLTTPQYKIETDLLIKDNKGGLGGSSDLLKDLDLFSSNKIIDNEVQILKSKTIVTKVIQSLKLETSYYATEGVRKRELYGNLPFNVELLKAPADIDNSNKLSIRLLNTNEAEVNSKKALLNYPVQTDEGLILVTLNPSWKGPFNQLFDIKFNSLAGLVERYSQNLKIDPVSKQATVLTISIEDAIPQRGMDFLNEIIKEYNNAAIEDKNGVTSNTLFFINGRLKVIEQGLGKVEENVAQYKSHNRIANIGTQSQILLQGIGDNDTQLNKVLVQLSVLQNLEDYLHKNNDQPSALPSMFGIDDPTLLGLVTQLGEAQLKKLALLQTIPETNPIVSSYTDQITALKQAISKSVQNLKKGLQVTKQQLQTKNNQFEGVVKQVPSQERGLLDVMRQQHLQDTLFMYLLQKREETEMKLASVVADSRTIDKAWSSLNPVKPVKQLIYLLFFIAGIAVPAGVIYLKDLLNFKISRRQDIERITKAPLIAEISHSTEGGELLVSNRPRSMVAEQVRALRTNLQFIIPNESQKVLLFTSGISGEGKSFISLNLGASLAMSGKKVVILELDLRKPKLHAGLGIDNKAGLSNYLIGKVSCKEILTQIPQQNNYFIITSGPIPPNPAELLVNGQIPKLLEELKQDFDYIILDAPPVGLVTDASNIRPVCRCNHVHCKA
ncbi:MAG TPA: capsular biosynthesis protein [Mucilaginibacter sp.]|nr:capsular biosynthesis protein [Mucilaginibacter sp.]